MTNGILYPVPKLHTHTVYLHYILTSKHMPLIHLSKGLVYCSYFILILFLIISIIIISSPTPPTMSHYWDLLLWSTKLPPHTIISSLLTPPHPQPLVQLSSSNGCEVTPTPVFQNLSIISVLQIESNLLVLGMMTIPSRKQLHLSASTALCITLLRHSHTTDLSWLLWNFFNMSGPLHTY